MKSITLFLISLVVVTITSSQMEEQTFAFDARKLSAPVDVFPLAVGNQWTYGYSWHSFNEISEYFDSGTVEIKVIGKIHTADSTRWLMQQTSQIWFWSLYGLPNEPKITVDSIELIELHQGQHQLYMAAEVDKITRSVFPFFHYRDTIVLRYNVVDDNGIATITSQATTLPGIINYNFRQGVGLSSIFVSDGCTCMTGYSGHHVLREYTITGVLSPLKELFPQDIWLYQNYPNPFNPTTIIGYQLPMNSYVTLNVFDPLGREVATLVNDFRLAGKYAVEFKAASLASGIYLYQLQAGNFVKTKKLVLLK